MISINAPQQLIKIFNLSLLIIVVGWLSSCGSGDADKITAIPTTDATQDKFPVDSAPDTDTQSDAETNTDTGTDSNNDAGSDTGADVDADNNPSTPVDNNTNDDPVNTAPTVFIKSPGSAIQYFSDTNISFIGTAFDDEDGNVSSALSWQSDISGSIGTGESVLARLPSGTHNITLTAIDSEGLEATTSVTAIVQVQSTTDDSADGSEPSTPTTSDPSNTLPSVFIQSPINNLSFTTQDIIEFNGIGSDLEDGELTNSQHQWFSSISGLLGSGKIINVSLPAGIHAIRLVATDLDQNTSTKNILLTVTEPDTLITVTGKVKSINGLFDVTVSTNNIETTTDNDGFFVLSNIPRVEDGQLSITFSKAGYVSTQKTIQIKTGQSFYASVNLLRYQFNANLDISSVLSIKVDDPQENKPALLSLSFQNDMIPGNPILNTHVAWNNPGTTFGRAVFPGLFIGAQSLTSAVDIPFEAIAQINIAMQDKQGNNIKTLLKPILAEIRLPDIFQSGGLREGEFIADDPIKGNVRWWSYNEGNAVWLREDADPSTTEIDNAIIYADASGVLYASANVTHLSWWGIHRAITQTACLCTIVNDADNNPTSGISVIAEGITYAGNSLPVFSDNNGKTCLNVKKSIDSFSRERVKINASYQGSDTYYIVSAESEGDISNNEIYTPLITGNAATSNTCAALTNKLLISFSGRVSGVLRSEVTGAAISNYQINSSSGNSVKTNSLGEYSITVPLKEITLYGNNLSPQSLTLSEASPTANIDFILPNRLPVSVLISNPSGPINNSGDSSNINGGKVTLTTLAIDKDGDAISYQWLINNIIVNDAIDPVLHWIAPATGYGTETFTVIVSDSLGSTKRSHSIDWGSAAVGEDFQIVIKNNIRQNMPVKDVRVILYNADGKTYQAKNVKISDDNGQVSFGALTHGRGTISIDRSTANNRNIDTFVEIPLTPITFYIEDKFETCSGEIANFSAGIDQVNSSTDTWYLLPGKQSADINSTINNTKLCPEDTQNDGQISLLAVGSNADNEILNYGYLLDQTIEPNVSNTDIFNINLDKNLETLSLDPGNAIIADITVSAVRKDVYYSMFYRKPETGFLNRIKFPTDFPVDSYTVYTRYLGNASDTFIRTRQNINSFAQTLTLQAPDLQFSQFQFNTNLKMFNWNFSGSGNKDLYVIFLYSSDVIDTTWRVWLSNNVRRWTIIDLEDSAVFQGENFTADIRSVDFDLATSKDDYWQLLGSGNSLIDVIKTGYSTGIKSITQKDPFLTTGN